MHCDLAEVTVDRLKSVPVVHHDAFPINAQRGRVHYAAVVRSYHAHVLGDGEIVAEMDFLADLFPLVEVVPYVREARFHSGIGLLQKRL
jgi:hypothetical protein